MDGVRWCCEGNHPTEDDGLPCHKCEELKKEEAQLE